MWGVFKASACVLGKQTMVVDNKSDLLISEYHQDIVCQRNPTRPQHLDSKEYAHEYHKI